MIPSAFESWLHFTLERNAAELLRREKYITLVEAEGLDLTPEFIKFAPTEQDVIDAIMRLRNEQA